MRDQRMPAVAIDLGDCVACAGPAVCQLAHDGALADAVDRVLDRWADHLRWLGVDPAALTTFLGDAGLEPNAHPSQVLLAVACLLEESVGGLPRSEAAQERVLRP